MAKSESILIDSYIKMSVLVSMISSALIKTGHRHVCLYWLVAGASSSLLSGGWGVQGTSLAWARCPGTRGVLTRGWCAKLETEVMARGGPAKPEVGLLSGSASLPSEAGAMCGPLRWPPAEPRGSLNSQSLSAKLESLNWISQPRLQSWCHWKHFETNYLTYNKFGRWVKF